MTQSIPQIRLPGGESVPALGLGTWMMGERSRDRVREIAALRLGIELGMTLVDTAEMYAAGTAEEIVAEAIAGQREQVYLVSKVYPHNAGRKSAIAACERSLKRLRVEQLDLYLLHWRGNVPLAETVAAFETLRHDSKIRAWGVSNFDRGDMDELLALPDGNRCAANQVLYHLGCRGVEWDVLPLCRRLGIALMAYSPIGRGELLRHPGLKAVAATVEASTAQVALAWLLARSGVIAIPKASDEKHVHDNRAAADIVLRPEHFAMLDRAFPPPAGPSPLAMI